MNNGVHRLPRATPGLFITEIKDIFVEKLHVDGTVRYTLE